MKPTNDPGPLGQTDPDSEYTQVTTKKQSKKFKDPIIKFKPSMQGLLKDYMERLEEVRLHLDSLERTSRYVYDSCHGRNNEKTEAAYNVLRTSLMDRELDLWRYVFMFALTVPEKERERIKAAAHDRFLSKHWSILDHMYNGRTPKQWLTADEQTFRDMCTEAFKPKEK